MRPMFLKVPEGKTVKNRMHLDFQAADRAAEVARVRGLGATEHATHQDYGLTWTVMTVLRAMSSVSYRPDTIRGAQGGWGRSTAPPSRTRPGRPPLQRWLLPVGSPEVHAWSCKRVREEGERAAPRSWR